MLRSSRILAQSTPLARKRLFSQVSSARVRQIAQRPSAVLLTSVAVVAGSLWYASHDVIYGDATTNAKDVASKAGPVNGVSPEDGSLSTLVWGSNRCVRLFTVLCGG